MTQTLEEGMDELYKQLDSIALKTATAAGTKCTKGCAHCCYLFALCGPADGLRIANHILERDDWKEWLPKLSVAAGKASYEGVNKRTYFEKEIPCVFLDVQQGTCRIYENRPACCRFHWVLSDPKDCSPKAPKTTKTAAINFLGLEAEVFNIDMQVMEQMGWTVPPVSPIPVMVLWMMELLTREDLARNAEVMKYCIGVPEPFKWANLYTEGLMEEGLGISGEVGIDEFRKAQDGSS